MAGQSGNEHEGPGSPSRRLARLAADREVLDLAAAGHSQADIARQLGVSRQAVSKRMQRMRQSTYRANADDLDRWRSAQLELHDALRNTLWEQIQHAAADGDGKTVAALVGQMIRLDERDSRIMGTDAPTRVHQTGEMLPPTEEDARAALRAVGIDPDSVAV